MPPPRKKSRRSAKCETLQPRSDPPWDLTDCSRFLQYHCPSQNCSFHSASVIDFRGHMRAKHKSLLSVPTVINIEEFENQNLHPLVVVKKEIDLPFEVPVKQEEGSDRSEGDSDADAADDFSDHDDYQPDFNELSDGDDGDCQDNDSSGGVSEVVNSSLSKLSGLGISISKTPSASKEQEKRRSLTKVAPKTLPQRRSASTFTSEVQGLTLKCTKCDFTCNSVGNLQQHLAKAHRSDSDGGVKKEEDSDNIFGDNFLDDIGNDNVDVFDLKPDILLKKETPDLSFDSIIRAPPPPRVPKQRPGGQNRSRNVQLPNATFVKFRCKHCSEDFRNYFDLKTHNENEHEDKEIEFTKRIHRWKDRVNEIDEFVKELEGVSYKCKHCDYSTTAKDLRGIHMELKHQDSSEVVIYKCDLCDFKGKQRSAINAHKVSIHKVGRKKSQPRLLNFKPMPQPKPKPKLVEFKKRSDPVDMKVIPTRVMLVCKLCEREFKYYHVIKDHFMKTHKKLEEEIAFTKKVIKVIMQTTPNREDMF